MGIHVRLVQAALATLVILAASPARADTTRLGLQVDWLKTILDAQAWLGAGARDAKAEREARPAPAAEADLVLPLMGWRPHVSLLGRDWGDSFLLSGRLSAIDVFRLSRDSRMVVTRVSFGDGTIVPFVQIGVGQWRVDTSWLLGWVEDTEVAAQAGAGMELRVAGAYSIALETDYTVLYRDQRLPTNVPFPRMWGALAASRIRF